MWRAVTGNSGNEERIAGIQSVINILLVHHRGETNLRGGRNGRTDIPDSITNLPAGRGRTNLNPGRGRSLGQRWNRYDGGDGRSSGDLAIGQHTVVTRCRSNAVGFKLSPFLKNIVNPPQPPHARREVWIEM